MKAVGMSDRLTFREDVRPQKYGDNRTFHEYRVLMFQGSRLVGVIKGPRRSSQTRMAALKAAREHIDFMSTHRLFVIRVTRKHISDGRARSCQNCAIAQALWHNQERMGYRRFGSAFDVSPYGGAFTEPRGLVLRDHWGHTELAIPAKDMPEIVHGMINERPAHEGMAEWAMNWDEWAESRDMSLSEWRDKHGYDDGERPCKPGPCSFVLDLDAFVSDLAAKEGA